MMRRLRRTQSGCVRSEAWSPEEATALERLSTRHGQLLLQPHMEFLGGSHVRLFDLQSEDGFDACEVFLKDLEETADLLNVELASRQYRRGFSLNYRAVFPDGKRHYRADVLEVSTDRHACIWVNGDKFELSPEALTKAEKLQLSLLKVGTLLLQWRTAGLADRNAENDESVTPGYPCREELLEALGDLDSAWASFEYRYISDLIQIENRARQLVYEAVQAEQLLTQLENSPDATSEAKLRARASLASCVGRLNSVANLQRKGRDDLSAEVLDCAADALNPDIVGIEVASSAAARILAGDILGAFTSLREYLRQVSRCLERVDPHLCKNDGLVARLVDWEASWEMAGRYFRDMRVLQALSGLVSGLQGLQVAIPKMTSMCEDCDVELFLVLPRLTLLCFLSDNTEMQGDLLKLYLPHHFVGSAPGAFLLDLIQDFKAAQFELTRLAHAVKFGELAGSMAWQALAHRAVGFEGDTALEGWGPLEESDKQAAVQALETFFHKLEAWSVDLQRHCPEDWNQCCAVLVQCLNGTSKRRDAGKFRV